MNKGRTCYVKWDKPKKKITTHWIYSFSIHKYNSHIRSSPALIIAKDVEEAAEFYMEAVRFDWNINPKVWEIIKGHDGFEIRITVNRDIPHYHFKRNKVIIEEKTQETKVVEEVIPVYIAQHELKEGVLNIPRWFWRY